MLNEPIHPKNRSVLMDQNRPITLKGTMSVKNYHFLEARDRISERLKTKRYKLALKKFNLANGFSFE